MGCRIDQCSGRRVLEVVDSAALLSGVGFSPGFTRLLERGRSAGADGPGISRLVQGGARLVGACSARRMARVWGSGSGGW